MPQRTFILIATLFAAIVATCLATVAGAPQTTAALVAARERAYRANNLGVARLEQFDFTGAAAAFRDALSADSTLGLARLNLGISLFYAADMTGAERELTAARTNLPGRPQPDYMLGLVARTADRVDDAVASFERVRAIDANDVGTLVNLGQLYRQQRRDAEAVALLRRAVALEPYNATAAYALAQSLLRTGGETEGEALMTRFETLRESAFAVTYAQTYLDQGRYAEAISSTGAEAELVDPREPATRFVNATPAFLPPAARPAPGPAAPRGSTVPSSPAGAGSVALFDLDGDRDLDLLDSRAAGLRIFRNDAGRFVDASAALGANRTGNTTSTLAGDYDNDGDVDLVLLRPTGLMLLQRNAARVYVNVTAQAGLADGPAAPQSAAWLDADHDGDADLIVSFGAAATTASTRLYRNNGNGRFTDITESAGLATTRPVAAVVPTDFDNRREVDILMVASSGDPLLFRNLREGTFKDVAAEVALALGSPTDQVAMAAAGDVNKDGFVDFFFARQTAGAFALSDGVGKFTVRQAPGATAGALAAQFADYDSDGLLDLVVLSRSGPHVFRNTGQAWTEITAALPSSVPELASATSLATGDIDGDGRLDLVTRGPAGLTILRNTGGEARALPVSLRARVSNRVAAGSKIDMRSGSLWQRLETFAATPAPAPADIRFGLGTRTAVDVVRVLWPSGILQAETPAALPRGRLPIEELDRKPSSCPYLFTWNGERFEFVTDFMGGGEMGYWVAPGTRAAPDPDEYVRIRGDQLRQHDGRYELRVTNELEEALFLDRAALEVVAHPIGVDVYPNEGLGAVTTPHRIYTTTNARPPLAAADGDGLDVLDRVRAIDRRYVDSFGLSSVRGYAAEHTLTLTLPPPNADGRRVLLLNGWTDYAFSSDNVAAGQADLVLLPPSLEVREPSGAWRTAIQDIGVPVGRPQTVVVDLTDKIPSSAREVRIRTSMRIYWDQILVDTSNGHSPFVANRLEAMSAALRLRGYSKEVTPDGREPYGYDYQAVAQNAPWKLMPGRYTREGDVLPLIGATDDMFVVSRTGDEIAISFDATALPALPTGWTRTYFLYADGFSKEMNLHSASPDALSPLPFHAMKAYPYELPETFPSTPAHRAYVEKYNTRVVPRMLPALVPTK